MNAVVANDIIEHRLDSEVGTESAIDVASPDVGHWTLITPFFWPQVGGIQQYLAMICRALGPAQVTVIGPKLRTTHQASDDTSLSQYTIRRPFSDRLRFAHTALVAFSEARKRRGGIIIGVARSSAISAVAYKFLFGIPYVVCCHGKELVTHSSLQRWTNRLLLARADLVIANSTFTADLAARCGASRTKIELLRPALSASKRMDTASRREALRDEYGLHDRRIILTVGRLVARKGHELVLRSLRSLADDDRRILYVIVGDGHERVRLERLADDLGVRDAVLFAGRVSDEDLTAWFDLADVFVMVSRSDDRDIEGFGIVYLEAAAAGKPVVAGRGGGVGDAMIDGDTGLLVDPTSESELLAVLRRLLRNPAEAVAMGDAGRQWVTTQCSESHFASRLKMILSTIPKAR